MIHIYSLYNKVVSDITSFCKTVQISGELSQCARKLELDMVYANYDINQPTPQIGCGNLVWVVEDEEGEIFRGIVFDRELNGNNETKITAYDYLIYFTKSKFSYNLTNISPEDITKKVCEDAGISVGSIAETGISVNLISQNSSFYETIMKAYTQASKQNGKRYIPIMNVDKLDIIEKGQLLSKVALSCDSNIEQATYTDSIDSMINSVRIYDANGNQIDEIKEENWIKTCGMLQDSYTQEEDKDYTTVAQNMLKGMENTFKVNALGNISCKTGYAVNVKVPWFYLTKAGVTMYIDSDTHTWDLASGKYEMELSLNFSNKMDLKEE